MYQLIYKKTSQKFSDRTKSDKSGLIKAGGERIEDIGTTGGGLGHTTIHGSFNLYKEQPIDFNAKLVSNPMVIGSDRVTWEYVNKNRRYGGKNQPDICSVDLYISLKVPI